MEVMEVSMGISTPLKRALRGAVLVKRASKAMRNNFA
jgi:hypothetical protein